MANAALEKGRASNFFYIDLFYLKSSYRTNNTEMERANEREKERGVNLLSTDLVFKQSPLARLGSGQS